MRDMAMAWLWTSLCVASAFAAPTISLPAGLTPHVQPAAAGRIDWTEGVILAEGKGFSETRDDQGQLMAQRAAAVDASRNALAIALGVRLDDKKVVGDQGNARITIRGVIQGHEVTDSQWFPAEDPPRARVTLRVPLWGARGVATVFYDQQRAVAARRQNRLPLIAEGVDVSESVLIIDTRGHKVTPCLYPVVADRRGRIVYDVSRINVAGRAGRSVVQYAESPLTFEDLSRADDVAPRPRLASYQSPETPTTQPATQPATQPTPDDATDPPGRRRRKRIVVKAAPDAESAARIVLTPEDAEALRQDPEAASLLRAGRVVVVVDSAAAGIEGRGPAVEPEQSIALAHP